MRKSTVAFAVILIGTIFGAMAISNFILIYTPQSSSQPPTVAPTTVPTSTPIVTPKQTVEPAPIAPKPIIIPEPSTLKVVSPIENTTYKTNSIELTYNIDSKVLWSYYGLDLSKPNSGSSQYTGINELFTLNGLMPFKGNITLNVPEGQHRIMIAVQTEESRSSSVPIAFQTIDFIVDLTP